MGINVVIVAAIALLVLIIIALVTTQGGRKLNEGANGCNANGGRCAAFPSELPGDEFDWVERRDLSCGETSEDTCYVYQFT